MSDETPNIASGKAIYMLDKGACQRVAQLPLPGVIILVHGVNSDGEWFEATEQGLCAGLNTRLGRDDKCMKVAGVEGGRLEPVTFLSELSPEGFLNPKRTAKTFITDKPNHSPVIRFRWGYKAHKDDMAEFGTGVWLNENNYWGGGPFANGCSALPDLWGEGLDDSLFLWIAAQHLNPEPGRDVYACPPRHYYAFAAKRLAELVKLIRQKQADIPITIVCHSQGNMIGLGAAFYGAQIGKVKDPQRKLCRVQIGEVKDADGKSAPAVADSYVLANAPYSVVQKLGADDWTQLGNVNAKGQSGRVTGPARRETLANFFEIIGARKGKEQPEDYVHKWIANPNHDFDVGKDREKYINYGRVTLYCNPHDRVISALTVQGIGWRGMDENDIKETNGRGVFVQRVWAQGNPVGPQKPYRYWDGKSQFWNPESRSAKFSLSKGLDANRNYVAKLCTLVSAPVIGLLVWIADKVGAMKINAMPDETWTLPIEAPTLPEDHMPTARRLGQPTSFDQGMDPDTDLLQPKDPKNKDDPYDDFRPAKGKDSDNAADEGRLKYEHRARLRMQDRRAGGDGTGADPDGQASPEWVEWSRKKVASYLKESLDQQATDHSTIMTCAENIEKVLAYDVAVGISRLEPADWTELRVAADWQLAEGVDDASPLKKFGRYFDTGRWEDGKKLNEHPDFSPRLNRAAIPPGIIDERNIPPARIPGDDR